MMISASDKASGARKKALIDTSMAFATWLESMPPDVWDRRISTLNRLQIIKRTRRINEEEQKELYQITARSSDSYPIMVGASILLERFKDAEYWLSYMDSNEQNEFRKFPIFHLWKNES